MYLVIYHVMLRSHLKHPDLVSESGSESVCISVLTR